MAANAVVNNLQLLGRVHVEASHVGGALHHCANHSVLGGLKPGGFTDAVVGRFQGASHCVLDGGAAEAGTRHALEYLNLTVEHGVVINYNVWIQEGLLQLKRRQPQERHIVAHIATAQRTQDRGRKLQLATAQHFVGLALSHVEDARIALNHGLDNKERIVESTN